MGELMGARWVEHVGGEAWWRTGGVRLAGLVDDFVEECACKGCKEVNA